MHSSCRSRCRKGQGQGQHRPGDSRGDRGPSPSPSPPNQINRSSENPYPHRHPHPHPHTHTHPHPHRDRPFPTHSSSQQLNQPISHYTDNHHDHEHDLPSVPLASEKRMGSYQMRQGLHFQMETPKFIHQIKAQMSGSTTTRFSTSNPSQRRIQSEIDLDDEGPLIVMDQDIILDATELNKLRVLHPKSDVNVNNSITPNSTLPDDDFTYSSPSRGPPTNPITGKFLFQAKQSPSPLSPINSSPQTSSTQGGKIIKKTTNKSSHSIIKPHSKSLPSKSSCKRGEKKAHHLLSFDD